MYMKDGINPLEMNYEVVETSACIQAMKDGKIAGAILTDYYAYKFVQNGTLKVLRSLTWDEDFQDEMAQGIAEGLVNYFAVSGT